MNVLDALVELAELSASQWGLLTTAQAAARGVSRVQLARLADAGGLVRIAHGVYRDAGAPSDEFEDLRAAWLSTEPSRLAEDRLGDQAAGVVVSGGSAAWLHRVGDLRADRHEFTVPVRRQSQRPQIRYRQRQLDGIDVTVVGGLPVTTLERTIADLVEERVDLSLVADVLADAVRVTRMDFERLEDLLGPLAERNGFRRGDGQGLFARLAELAGLDPVSLAREIASSGRLGELVAAEYLRRADLSKEALDQITSRHVQQFEPVVGSVGQLGGGRAVSLVAPAGPTVRMVELRQAAGRVVADQRNPPGRT